MAGATENWGHPSIKVLPPVKMQMDLKAICPYVSWSIKEMGSRFLKHVPSSHMEEEGGGNVPHELALTMVDP